MSDTTGDDGRSQRSFVSRLAAVVRKIIGRLVAKPERAHLAVFHYDLDYSRVPPAHEKAIARAARRLELVISRVTAEDDGDLDEITAIDEWKTGKEWSLQSLAEGWRCYVAKHRGRIVAITWVIVGGRVRDEPLEREFTLAPNEAYYYRAFTVPEIRGSGVMPLLGLHAVFDLPRTAAATRGVFVTNAHNRVMRKTVLSMGAQQAGVVGFVGLFGARLHYLWGRDAFRSTRRRFYLDLRSFSKRTRAGDRGDSGLAHA